MTIHGLKTWRGGAGFVLGVLCAWLLRDPITALLLGGRTFAGRSFAVQSGILLTLLLALSAGWFVLFAFVGRLFRRPLDRTGRAISAYLTERGLPCDAEGLLQQAGEELGSYLQQNVALLAGLGLVALFAYGFELFNLSITLDEELWAFKRLEPTEWIAEGRWGMYLLAILLVPYPIVPFVPLGLGLVFQIAAVLILLECWSVRSGAQKFVISSIAITFPSLAYIYVFSHSSFGIGIGYLCVALSLLLYARGAGRWRLLALLPATFAVAIYQPFLVALACAFLVYVLTLVLLRGERLLGRLLVIAAGLAVAGLAYSGIQQAVLALSGVPRDPYIVARLEPARLASDLAGIWGSFWYAVGAAYSGSEALYALPMSGLVILLLAGLWGFAANLLRSRATPATRLVAVTLLAVVVLLPLSFGFVTGGDYKGRWLLGLPIVAAGLTTLGMGTNARSFRAVLGVLGWFAVLQFVQSSNHLFASAQIAFDADRVLASELIGRIHEARSATTTDGELKYLLIVGALERPESDLMPKRDRSFGTSYFEMQPRDPSRATAFLQIVGYDGLEGLPEGRWLESLELANAMPAWPDRGSVRIWGDTLIVKFGEYILGQRQLICGTFEGGIPEQYSHWCAR